MAVRPTTQLGDPVIRAVAREVADPRSPETQQVVTDLIDSMRSADLVGMAAPQIGAGVRVFVSEIRGTKFREERPDDAGVRVFINPEIISSATKIAKGYEGCGSVAHAGLFAKVPRPNAVTVRALDAEGKAFELQATGLLARIIQHEVDHLDGKIFLDRMDNMGTLIGREAYLALADRNA